MTSMQSEFVIINFNLAGPRCLNWFLWCLEKGGGEQWDIQLELGVKCGPQYRVVTVVTSLLLNFASLLWLLPVSPVKNCRRGRGSGRPERWWGKVEFEHHRDTLTKHCPGQNIYTAIYMLYIYTYKWCIYTCIRFRKVYLYIHIVKAMVSSSHVRMWELDHKQRRLSTKELMLLNYAAGEDSWESLGLQGDQTSHS